MVPLWTQTYAKNIANKLFFPTPRIFLVVPRGQSLCSQSGDSIFPSHTYSGCLTWSLLKPARSFPLTSLRHGAVRDLWRGSGRGSQAASPAVRSHPWPTHVPSVTAPLSIFTMQLKFSGCTDALGVLWTWNFLIPKSHEVAAFLVLGLAPLCLAVLYFCPAHTGMMLQQWRNDA